MVQGKEIDFDEIHKKLLGENSLNSNDELIRYMNLPKLLSILELKSLHLTQAKKFEDKFEGMMPMNYTRFHTTSQSPSQVYQEQDIEVFRNKIYISSWNIFDSESYAMWKIYGEKYGVAIQSTVQKLNEIIREMDDTYLRKVKYINDSLVYAPVDDGPDFIDYFTSKKKFYSYEKEVRIIQIAEPNMKKTIKLGSVSDLISKIYISPFAEEWYGDLVKTIIQERYGENIEVIKSGIKL